MNKFIMIALMTTFATAGSLNYFKNCSKAVCSVPYSTCQNDKGCQSTLEVCEKRCATTDNANCIQQCIFSSNSMVAQKLAVCAASNQCFVQLECFGDITCPSTCKEPAKLGNQKCSSGSSYATWECISDYEKEIGREDCAEKSCVCKTIAAMDIYVVGCYC